MKQRIDQIRQILNEMEEGLASSPGVDGVRDFSALELPLIIQEIVDDLQPLLTPYEIAFYWHIFRQSLARNGNPVCRVSTKRLRSGIVKSSRATHEDSKVSEGKVRELLAALESIGAIRKEAEPNRDGTLYRVLVPDEIEACRKFRTERIAMEPTPEITDSELDYYNVRENRVKVYERDGYKCHYCDKQLTRLTATLDHVIPVAEGGDNGFSNLVTACLGCNSRKTGRPVGDFLAEQSR